MESQASQLDQHTGPVAPTWPADRRRQTAAWLVLMFTGASLGLLALLPRSPVLVWNHTESVPIGLYRVEHATPVRGDIVVIAPTGALRATLEAYGALARGRLLLKRLAATGGDRVCRDGAAISVNGAAAAVAKPATADGRALPAWSGCRLLASDDVLVLNPHAGSFDSRYYGPIDAGQILGVARPLIPLPSQEAL